MRRPTAKTAMRDFIDATRFLCTLLKQLPMRPLLGAIAVSVTLGALPMMLTAIYSVIRLLVDCYRDALNMRAQRFNGLINPTVPIDGESVTTNPFIPSLKPAETL
jgi:hypothetical protein